MVAAASPIAYGDWQALRGKTLGVPVKGADGHAITEYLLITHGLDPSKDVVLAETSQIQGRGKRGTADLGVVLPVSHKLDLLLSGKVDSIHSIPPLYPLYLQADGKIVAKNFYCWGDDPLLRTLPTGGIVVRRDYLDQNGSVVDAVVEWPAAARPGSCRARCCLHRAGGCRGARRALQRAQATDPTSEVPRTRARPPQRGREAT